MGTPVLVSEKQVETCKICGLAAPSLGTCDFNKFCSEDWAKGPRAGIDAHYYRCPHCGFIFTTSFDHFTSQDWSEHVYNEGYRAVDPDFNGSRGRSYAKLIATSLKGFESIRVLDYGGGLGCFAEALAADGWPNVSTYDPFVPKFSTRPESVADLIFSSEVLEHSPNPRKTFAEIASFMHPTSVIIATTLLSPAFSGPEILDWWYVAPRNGHVSIYSQSALNLLGCQLGMKVVSFNQCMHGFWRERPDWATEILPP